MSRGSSMSSILSYTTFFSPLESLEMNYCRSCGSRTIRTLRLQRWKRSIVWVISLGISRKFLNFQSFWKSLISFLTTWTTKSCRLFLKSAPLSSKDKWSLTKFSWKLLWMWDSPSISCKDTQKKRWSFQNLLWNFTNQSKSSRAKTSH